MLQNTGRDDEVDSWNSSENITDYTENVFKPYLARIDDKLHKGKTANSRHRFVCIGKTEAYLECKKPSNICGFFPYEG